MADISRSPFLRLETGGHTAVVKKVRFSPDGTELYTAGHDKVVRVWDVEIGALKRTLRVPIGPGAEGKSTPWTFRRTDGSWPRGDMDLREGNVSSGSSMPAPESDEWGGAFTLALIEGLSGRADTSPADGLIYIKEPDVYTTHRVKELTGGKQHPTMLFPITVTDFPIAAK